MCTDKTKLYGTTQLVMIMIVCSATVSLILIIVIGIFAVRR